MFKRLFAIAVLGAALVACTPGTPGSSTAVDPSLAMPTDGMMSAMPTDEMMSAMPSDSLMPSP